MLQTIHKYIQSQGILHAKPAYGSVQDGGSWWWMIQYKSFVLYILMTGVALHISQIEHAVFINKW